MKHWCRKDALSAARGLWRARGQKPEERTAQATLEMMDDVAVNQPYLLISRWYQRASDNQIKLFRKDWDQWCQETQSDLVTQKGNQNGNQ